MELTPKEVEQELDSSREEHDTVVDTNTGVGNSPIQIRCSERAKKPVIKLNLCLVLFTLTTRCNNKLI